MSLASGATGGVVKGGKPTFAVGVSLTDFSSGSGPTSYKKARSGVAPQRSTLVLSRNVSDAAQDMMGCYTVKDANATCKNSLNFREHEATS